jgi:hypothetical protein
MHRVFIIVALLFSFTANAGSLFGDDNSNDNKNTNSNNNVNLNGASAKAIASLQARTSSNARASQYQKALSLQGQSLSGVGSGNATTVSTQYERQAPSIAMGQGDPGYDCSLTGGIGGSVPGGSLTFQWSQASINCELAMLYKLGRKDAATVDRAYEAYDILFDRVMAQAAGDIFNARDPDVRNGR